MRSSKIGNPSLPTRDQLLSKTPEPIDHGEYDVFLEKKLMREAALLSRAAKKERMALKMARGKKQEPSLLEIPCFDFNNKDFIKRDDSDAKKFNIERMRATVARSVAPEVLLSPRLNNKETGRGAHRTFKNGFNSINQQQQAVTRNAQEYQNLSLKSREESPSDVMLQEKRQKDFGHKRSKFLSQYQTD